jgi:hypothetical protein
MKTYRPSGKIPLTGFGCLFLTAMLGAPILGIIYQLLIEVFLAKVFANLGEFIPGFLGAFIPGLDYIAGLPVINEILVAVTAVFCIVIAFSVVTLVGWLLLSGAINVGKVRNPVVGLIFGIMTGLITQVSSYYLSYSFFQSHSSNQRYENLGLPGAIGKFSPVQPEETSFVKYLQYKAGSDKAFWLKFILGLTWVQILAWASISAAVNEPFCEESKDWYQKERIVGTVHPAFKKEFVMLILQEDFVGAGLLLDTTTEELKKRYLAVYSRRSLSKSATMVYLTLKEVQENSKTKEKNDEEAAAEENTKELIEAVVGLVLEEEVILEQKEKKKEKVDANTEDLISGCISLENHQQLLFASAAKEVLASDRFVPPRLLKSSAHTMLAKLSEEYAGVQAIYLVDKVLSNQTNVVLHVLGVIVDRSIVDTDSRKKAIKNSLVSMTQKIKDFGPATVLILNDDLETLKSMRSVASLPFYHK